MIDRTIVLPSPLAAGGPRRRPLVVIAALLALGLHLAHALDTDCDGAESDGSGYSCTTAAPGELIPDIESSPTAQQIAVSKWQPKRTPTRRGDDNWYRVSLVGTATFNWYGVSYNTIYIGTNGYVSLDTGYTNEVSGGQIPDGAAPNAAVYAYGDNLTLESSGRVYYDQSTCLVDRDGDGFNDACFIVRWSGVPHKLGASYVTVTAELALDLDTGEAFIEIESETGSAAASHPRLVGSENAAGSDGLWFKAGADPDSRAAGGAGAQRFVLGFGDTLGPDPVSKLTSASGDGQVVTEWSDSPSPDAQGTLVVRNDSGPVGSDPQDGVSYTVGSFVGPGDLVVCDVPLGSTTCLDAPLVNDVVHNYRVYAYDDAQNYSSGIATTGLPRAASVYKWSFATESSSLAPVGVIAAEYVSAIGNDGFLHRIAESDGTRGAWDPPFLGSPVQARPVVGDLAYPGTGDRTAFVSGQDGLLYRYSLDDGTLDAVRDVIADANCSGGLQAGPVVSLDSIDDNANPNDDLVIVSTRCTDNRNKTLLYDHDLSALVAGFNGGGLLGMTNGSPRILYRSGENQLVYVTHRAPGETPALYVHELTPTGFLDPPWAAVNGIGDVDAGPELIERVRNSQYMVAVGGTDGVVHLYDAVNRVEPQFSSLVEFDAFDTSGDGPVKGLDASASSSGVTWLAWSTDSLVHGVRIGPDDAFDAASFWSAAVEGPSAPLVLQNVGTAGNYRAYVGTSGGQLLEFDATNGSLLRSWTVDAGKSVGDPTFDYNDGESQGIVVGTSGGLIVWVGL